MTHKSAVKGARYKYWIDSKSSREQAHLAIATVTETCPGIFVGVVQRDFVSNFGAVATAWKLLAHIAESAGR